jgi:hypothetical protein
MDKPSERKKPVKEFGDTDVNTVRTFGVDNKRETLDDLWDRPTILGMTDQQRMSNNYCKEATKKKGDLLDVLVDNADTRGPPLLNVSSTKRVL